MTATMTPDVQTVACYGTLRPGCGNYSIVQNLRHNVTRAVLPDHALYGAGAGFPYALPEPGATVAVDLLTFSDEAWPLALDRMDILEGVPHLYDRHQVPVITETGRELAWLYVPTDVERVRHYYDRIHSGDWFSIEAHTPGLKMRRRLADARREWS